jgi:hypothetical protein
MSPKPAPTPVPPTDQVHPEFLNLVPLIRRHALVTFRHRSAADREEAAAEAVAAAFESYLALKSRGKDPAKEFPSILAVFAVLHVKDDRHVGGRSSSTDVLSPKAQQRRGFRVEALPTCRTSHEELYASAVGQRRCDALEEQLRDNTRTPVPDQAAFRIDFPAFLRTLSHRDRELAQFLSLGHTASQAAARFRLSPGRVTQLRQRWCREWRLSQGEEAGAANTSQS